MYTNIALTTDGIILWILDQKARLVDYLKFIIGVNSMIIT